MADTVGLNFRIVDNNFTISQTCAATVNLVVVHGFGALIDTSWLSNLLLHDLPRANILEFNIDASSFFSSDRFDQQAEKFLIQLANYLSLQDHQSEEFIFVAHSLGGLLLTKALSLSFRSAPANEVARIAYLTRAVIFLGTPLHGSVQVLEACVRNYFGLYKFLSDRQGFDIDLPQGRLPFYQLACYLQLVQQDLKALHRYTSKLRFASFFEGARDQNYTAVIVPRDLVISYDIPAIALQRNHQDLCQFSRPDPSYKLLLGELKKHIIAPDSGYILGKVSHKSVPTIVPINLIVPAPPATTRTRFSIQGLAKRVLPSDLTPKIKHWLTGTQSSPVLWLHGKPGCGKTTLMGGLVQYCQRISGYQPSLTVSYSFGYKNTIKASKYTFSQALLDQLLHQIMYTRSALELSAVASDISDAIVSKTLPQDQSLITQRLEELLRHASQRHTVYVVVDALDECDQAEAAKIVYLLRKLSLQRTKCGGVRICLSSRGRLLQMQDEPCHHVDRENGPEIARFVKTEATELGNKQLHANTISQAVLDEITRKASGIFLWARLGIRVLVDAYRRGEDTLKVLQSLPEDLDSMYTTILDRIRKDDTMLARSAMRVMTWVLFAVRPLTLTELQDALSTTVERADSSEAAYDKRLCLRSHTVQEISPEFIKHIESQCYGLVEIEGKSSNAVGIPLEVGSKSKLIFIHRTVRDFLDGNLGLLRPDTPDPTSIRGIIHLECAEVSLQYLNSCQSALLVDGNGGSVSSTNFPFMDYASAFWIQHITAAEHEQLQIGILVSWLRRLFAMNPKHWLSSWVSIEKKFSQLRGSLFDSSCTFLHVASHFGLTRLTEAYLQYRSSIYGLHPEIDEQDGKGRTPLCFAAEAGQTQNVRILLHAGANVALADHVHGQTALQAAAWAGHEEVTRLLINAGAEFENSKNGTSALSGSAALGHHGVVKMLLDKGANANSTDMQRGQSALSLALSNRHKQVVSLLIQHGVDVNEKDVYTDLTPLHHAILSKDPLLVQMLVDAGAQVSHEPVSSLPLSQAMWIDRVMQMVHAQSPKTAVPIRQCTRGDSHSKSEAKAPAQSSTKQSKASSGSSSKRSFDIYNNQNEGEGQELPPNKRPSQNLPPDKTQGVMPLTFACPFLVFSTHRFRSKKCGTTGFLNIPQLKEHLHNHHRIHRCRTCGKCFTTPVELETHPQRQLCVGEGLKRDFADGYDGSQAEAVRSRRRNEDPENKWRDLYKILFPAAPEASITSPYYEMLHLTDFANVQNDHVRSSSFREQLERTVPSYLNEAVAELIRKFVAESLFLYEETRRPSTLVGMQNTVARQHTRRERQEINPDEPNSINFAPRQLPNDHYDPNNNSVIRDPEYHFKQAQTNHPSYVPSYDSGFQSLMTAPAIGQDEMHEDFGANHEQDQQMYGISQSDLMDPVYSYAEIAAPPPEMISYQPSLDLQQQPLPQQPPFDHLGGDTRRLAAAGLTNISRQTESSEVSPRSEALPDSVVVQSPLDLDDPNLLSLPAWFSKR